MRSFTILSPHTSMKSASKSKLMRDIAENASQKQLWKYIPDKIFKLKVTTARLKVKSRSHYNVTHLPHPTNVPSKCQLPTPDVLTVFEIHPRHTFSRCLPAQPHESPPECLPSCNVFVLESGKGSNGGNLVFRSGANFKRNLAYVVPYHPVKLQIDQTKCFKLESENGIPSGSHGRHLVFQNGANFKSNLS